MPPEAPPPHVPAWVLVLEDEDRLREELTRRIEASAPDLGPVRSASSAEAALAWVAEAAPTVAFVDIHLPGRNGVEFAQALADGTRVVYVTADDGHAVQAYEQGAVDYLLKPVTPERLARCLARLRGHPVHLGSEQKPATPPPPARTAPSLRWLAAQAGRRTRLIAVADLIYLQSDTRYTRAVTVEGEFLLDDTLKSLLPRLDPAEFRQVHRGTVVNLREVLWVDRDEGGGGRLQLRSVNQTLRVSPPFLKELAAFWA